MSTNLPVLEARGLSKTFPTHEGSILTVLEGLDLAVKAGELVCLLGPTGCGKTTLLRILLGLEKADSGTVLVAGVEPEEGHVPAGAVFQQNALLPWKSVLDNVAFPMEMRGTSRGRAREKALELLRLVRLEKASRAFPYELSGGMQQRASIARALAHDAGILLMDEPFGALDDQTRRVLQNILLDIRRERGSTILFVTHNIEEAIILGDRVLVMGRGRLLEDERIDLDRPRDPLDERFAARLLKLRALFAAAVDGGR